MSDMQTMDRENKKRQLRRNIIQMPGSESDDPMYDDRLSRYKKKKRFIAIVAVCFIAALGFTGYRYMNEYEYTGYSVQWERSMRYTDDAAKNTQAAETSTSDNTGSGGADEITTNGFGAESTGSSGGDTDSGDGNADSGDAAPAENSAETSVTEVSKNVSDSSFVKFAMYGDNMIKYTKDGASYIDATGKTIWTQSYEMKTPIISINGDYAVIADQQGNEMYICSKAGCTGTAKTQLPITKAAVSARGVAAAVVEDSTASYIFYFKKNGEALGINIKMLLSGDGYPVDIALSPDGKQIVMSIMYMKNGMLKNKVAFYDFSEIGKNVNNRFIAAFEEEFDDKMVGRVRYLNDQTVCAFSDKGLTFISVRNVIPDTNVIYVPVEEEIRSICYSDQYAAVVVDSTSGSPYRLDVYNTDGKRVTSIDFDYAYTGVLIDGDRLILYNEESCREYNLNGHEKFNGQFDFSVSLVRAGKNRANSLITAGSEVMKEIKLR